MESSMDGGHYTQQVAEDNFSAQRKIKHRKASINAILFHVKVSFLKSWNQGSFHVTEPTAGSEASATSGNWKQLGLSCFARSPSPLLPGDTPTGHDTQT